MIRTVIFDLGNVIIPFDFARGYRMLSSRCGLAPEEIPLRIGSTDLVTRFESGQIETGDFVRRLTSLLGLQMTVEEFAEVWSAIFEQETLIPDSLPEQLRASGLRLLLLSNTNDLHMRYVRKNYGILRHFHHQVLSYEVGAMKPSPRIFAEALANADCAPGECFFTDDIPAYVEAAKQAGIDAEQFQGLPKLRQDLKLRGLL